MIKENFMRAEEGDESVKDYAVEGEQTLNRIKDAQHSSDNPLTRIARRLFRLLPGRAGGA
ncbi:hypothetical protein A9X01_20350 [Mycobacterium asiaticum]|uniref:Uncharacterized protein n=2 Tax=Mycobacterium asiaticum TaxID=1790 RepID=A0A1A3CAF3_MYCAS|nr:hypothetical protein A9X01_20350 [Mycobacterium asiaticum]